MDEDNVFAASPDHVKAAKLADGGDVSKLQAMINAGLDINRLIPLSIKMANNKPHQITLLHWAVASQNEQAVATLLKVGANPNLPEAIGRTPLYLSIEKNSDEIFGLLLEHGADPNQVFHYAVRQVPLITAFDAERFDRAEQLLKKDANLEAQLRDDDKTLLLYQASMGQWTSVRWLIDHGANFVATATHPPGFNLTCAVKFSIKTGSLDPKSRAFADRNWTKDFLLKNGANESQFDPSSWGCK